MTNYEVFNAPAWYSGGSLVRNAATGGLLAGVGHNQHRAWAFPLCTPRGLNVLQEYAYDHSFHNGMFVGQGMVSLAGGEPANFWAPAPDWRDQNNIVYQHLGQLRYGEPPKVEDAADGVRFTYQNVWHDEHNTPMFDEERTFRVWTASDAVFCELSSRKRAAYGPLEFRKAKHGSICTRTQPQLLPALGGEILAGREGTIHRGREDEVAMIRPATLLPTRITCRAWGVLASAC